MIQQTKNAIDSLLACGLKRKEFSVRTPQNSRGEYDDPIIIIWGSLERRIELAEVLATRFRVTKMTGTRSGKPEVLGVTVDYCCGSKAGLRHLDVDKISKLVGEDTEDA